MDFEPVVKRIVARTVADGGATYSFKKDVMLEPADVWLYPQFPGLTKIVPVDDLAAELAHFLADYTTVLDNEALYVGTWINPENNLCYIDVIASADTQEEARAKAQHLSNDQGRQVISIYNPATRQAIDI